MQKGIFVVLDGIDGSGKATQSRMLAERLAQEGVATEKLDFPMYDRSFFGSFLGECLAGKHGDFLHLDPKIASTLYALDRFQAAPKIRECLEKGVVVIADRFSTSNQIHQGGKVVDQEKRTAFLNWIDEMEHQVLDVPRPSAVVYLRVPVDVSVGLLAKAREVKNSHAAGKDSVEKDRMYLERSFESAERLAKDAGWHLIECTKDNAMRTPEEIHEEVYAFVKKMLA